PHHDRVTGVDGDGRLMRGRERVHAVVPRGLNPVHSHVHDYPERVRASPCPARCGGYRRTVAARRAGAGGPSRSHGQGSGTGRCRFSCVTDAELTEPDNTAVRTALWRALHVEVDAPPHVL